MIIGNNPMCVWITIPIKMLYNKPKLDSDPILKYKNLSLNANNYIYD